MRSTEASTGACLGCGFRVNYCGGVRGCSSGWILRTAPGTSEQKTQHAHLARKPHHSGTPLSDFLSSPNTRPCSSESKSARLFLFAFRIIRRTIVFNVLAVIPRCSSM